ncbi:multiubiquitin domain-containing protein [Mucilaginibacter boryungensis]|uniref:Multiubiquitin domain-containing protein n=1 Tax=Mucilaginibacter boryungensis TaxID=768480 RepID=A0ABR9XLF9_9SPHI|nr:multiubiquitin domain-containing protein [Mucilaginibacter boryungensis]MBE9668219.1 multiubiquitin domain-containing protein [Mucilaginibacter boryungensis]
MENIKEPHEVSHFATSVNDVELLFNEPKVSGLQLMEKANLKHIECLDLFQLFEGDFKKIATDETVDLSAKGFERFITKDAEYRNYSVNNDPEVTDKRELTSVEILKLAGIDPEEHFLILVNKDGSKVSYGHQPQVKIKIECGGMHFVTERKDCVLDIEHCFSCGVIPVIAFKYIIKINTTPFTVGKPAMTGREILALINETPETYYLRYKHTGGSKIVEADEVVDFTACGIERFSAKAKNCTEGRVNKRDFLLPQEDVSYLEEKGLAYETLLSDGAQWVILRDYPLPAGYSQRHTDVAIRIPQNYPIAPLDMFYMYPNLARTDGQPIGALSPLAIEDKQYQQWSRHRTANNQWVPGEDNLATHIALMNHSLNEEFTKR